MILRPTLGSLTRAALCTGAFLLQGATLLMASSHLIFLGTYTKTTSRGIYATWLNDETGELTAPVLVAETPSPTWLTLSPDKRRLYAVHASKAQAVGYSVDGASGQLTPLPASPLAKETAGGPCHLAVDATNRTLVAANYGDGYVAALAIQADGTLGAPNIVQHTGHGPNPKRQDKPHVHSVTLSPDNRFVIVCDLGLDQIFTYALDAAAAKLTPADPAFVASAPGAGPRHFKFSADGKHGYNLTEMGATLDVYDYDAKRGALTPVQTLSTLPPFGLGFCASCTLLPPFAAFAPTDHTTTAAFDASASLLGERFGWGE